VSPTRSDEFLAVRLDLDRVPPRPFAFTAKAMFFITDNQGISAWPWNTTALERRARHFAVVHHHHASWPIEAGEHR